MLDSIRRKIRRFLKASSKREHSIPSETRFIPNFDRKQGEYYCRLLISGGRGKMLGEEILQQLDQGYLFPSTYERLSRWVNPEREEYSAQPLALKISLLLFGKRISRQG